MDAQAVRARLGQVAADGMNAQASASHRPSPPNQGKAKWSKETYITLLAMLRILAHLIGRYGLHSVQRRPPPAPRLSSHGHHLD